MDLSVSAQRVVKAYVREEYETDKFQKTSGNIYKLFMKAELRKLYVLIDGYGANEYRASSCLLHSKREIIKYVFKFKKVRITK